MDEESRQRIAKRVAYVSGGFYRQDLAQKAVEQVLELVPQPVGERVRDEGDSTLVELVCETRLFTATVTEEKDDSILVKLGARVLDGALIDVSMEQRGRQGDRRVWAFRFSEDDTLTVDRHDDEPFARALAGRLGWANHT